MRLCPKFHGSGGPVAVVLCLAAATVLLQGASPASADSDADVRALPAEARVTTAPAGATSQPAGATSQPAGARQLPDTRSWRGLAKDSRGPQGREGADSGSSMAQLLAAAMVVVVLGAAAVFVFRRWGPKIASRTGRQIIVADTAHLAPGKTLHVIQAHGRRLLVAATKERVSLLSDLGSDEELAPNGQEGDVR